MERKLVLAGFSIEDESRQGFVVHSPSGRRLEIRVKGVRRYQHSWVAKRRFAARDDQALAVVTYFPGEPKHVYRFPGAALRRVPPALSALIKNYDYEDDAGEPEFGLELAERTRPLLDGFRFEEVIRQPGRRQGALEQNQ